MSTEIYTQEDGDKFTSALFQVASQIPPEEVFLILISIVAMIRTDSEEETITLTFNNKFKALQDKLHDQSK